MPGEPAAHRTMTAGEYLAWEREQPSRHGFDRGVVFDMAGGSLRHNALVASAIRLLGNLFEGKGRRVLATDMRIGVRPGEKYVYADASVVCGPIETETGTTDVLANPTILVEVLSPSTEAYDRGAKWVDYQRLGSLRDYLLVSQDVARIEHYRREADGSWRYAIAEADGRVTLSSGAELEVDPVFEGVMDLPGGD